VWQTECRIIVSSIFDSQPGHRSGGNEITFKGSVNKLHQMANLEIRYQFFYLHNLVNFLWDQFVACQKD